MAVTLQSDGVKFSDNSVQTTAAVGVGGIEVFTTVGSSTWTRPSHVTKVWVCVVGGGGGAAATGRAGSGGGSGGTIMWREVSVSANVTVTVGYAGSLTASFTNKGNKSELNGTAGGTSSFGGVGTVGAGGGGGGHSDNDDVEIGGSGGTASGTGSFAGERGYNSNNHGIALGGRSAFGSKGAGGTVTLNPDQTGRVAGAGIVIVAY
jgi:hypothetical protein